MCFALSSGCGTRRGFPELPHSSVSFLQLSPFCPVALARECWSRKEITLRCLHVSRFRPRFQYVLREKSATGQGGRRRGPGRPGAPGKALLSLSPDFLTWNDDICLASQGPEGIWFNVHVKHKAIIWMDRSLQKPNSDDLPKDLLGFMWWTNRALCSLLWSPIAIYCRMRSF